MPFYRPDQPITALDLFLTTHCNLACSECCMHMPILKNPEHISLETLQYVGEIFYGIDHLCITGGEPTVHPDFYTMVPQLRDLFGCRHLTLQTDGYKVIEYQDVLHHFDDIKISHYANNKKETEFLAKNFHDSRPPGETIHLSKSRRAADPHPCFRAGSAVAFAHGKIYPCCVVPGRASNGIEPTPNWREEIMKAPLLCETCLFAEEEEVSFPMDADPFPNVIEMNPDAPTILGLTTDSWFSDRASILIAPPEEKEQLMIQFESQAPLAVYPITLSFESDDSALYTHTIKKVGISRVNLPVREWVTQKGVFEIAVKSDRTYVPAELQPGNPDSRRLSVRVVRARYQ